VLVYSLLMIAVCALGPLRCGDYSAGMWNEVGDRIVRVPLSCRHLTADKRKLGDAGTLALAELLLHNFSHQVPKEYWEGRGRHLEALELPSNGIGSTSARRLSHALQNRSGRVNVATMHTLDLRDNHLGDEGARGVGGLLGSLAGKTIVKLDLRDNEIGPAGAEAIAAGLLMGGARHLEHLNLAVNDLEDRGAKALAEALEKQQPGVHGVRPLRCLHLSATGLTAEGLAAIATALGVRASRLRRLDLGGNALGLAGGQVLARNIERMILLEHLEIPHSALGDMAAIEIFAAIARVQLRRSELPVPAHERPRGLIYLDLAASELEDGAAKALAQLLGNPAMPLRHVRLNNNRITELGAQMILKALRRSGLPTVVEVAGNQVSSEVTDALQSEAKRATISTNLKEDVLKTEL